MLILTASSPCQFSNMGWLYKTKGHKLRHFRLLTLWLFKKKMPVLHFLRLNRITLQWALGKVLTAYYFPFVNLSLAGMPKDFILFALCLWETCSWRDCAPETLGAAEWEPCFSCVLPCGVLVYLPTLLWVFSAQLAANLLWITPLLAITAQIPAETQHDDHDNTLPCERRERKTST